MLLKKIGVLVFGFMYLVSVDLMDRSVVCILISDCSTLKKLVSKNSVKAVELGK